MDPSELQIQQSLLIIEINNLKTRRDQLIAAKNSDDNRENTNQQSLLSSYNREILDIKKQLVVMSRKLLELNMEIESALDS